MKPQSQNQPTIGEVRQRDPDALADEIVELERSIAIARQRLVAALAAADEATLRAVISKSRNADDEATADAIEPDEFESLIRLYNAGAISAAELEAKLRSR
jgi:hypothetical protein